MDVKLRHAALTMMLLASGAIHAQTSVADIDQIQADTLRLRAEASQARAAKDLAELRGDALSNGTADSGLPVARGVFGGNGRRYVSFLYPTGGTAEAEAGGTIPGNYVVRSFDTAGVVLTKRGRVYRIPFSMRAPTPAADVPVAPGMGQTFAPPVSVPPMR